jgi:hypothetical protein
MLITVTNVSADQVYVSAARKTLDAAESFVFSRSQAQYDAEVALKQMVADGTVTATFAAEDSDIVNTGETVVAPGPDSMGVSDLLVLRKAFTAGTTGSADDVAVALAVPFGFRIVDVKLVVLTVKAAATVTLRTATAGGGSALSEALSVATAGYVRLGTASTATTTVAAGGNVYLRRSDRACAGELLIELIKT